ncbi:MAG: hypothetical protein AABN33_18360 [Acidobacteriota bacterium]
MKPIYCKACKRKQNVEVAAGTIGEVRIKCQRHSCGRWFIVQLPVPVAAAPQLKLVASGRRNVASRA